MPDPVHLGILRKNIATWNNWRSENEHIQPDLSRADLSGANLYGANLSSANLSSANLSHANLSSANLSVAFPSNADLSGEHLSRAKLSRADLSGANLSHADLSGAYLSHADLSGADLSGANLSGANLSSAILPRADLSHAILSRANLSRANLSRANLSHTILSHTILYQAILPRVDLSHAILSHAILPRADLSHANLSHANLSDAVLSHANLLNANLFNADVTGTHLTGMQLNQANFRAILSVPLGTHLPASELAQVIQGLANLYRITAQVYNKEGNTKATKLIIHRISIGTPNIAEFIGTLPEITAISAALLAVIKVPKSLGEEAKGISGAQRSWIEGTLLKQKSKIRLELSQKHQDSIEYSFQILSILPSLIRDRPRIYLEKTTTYEAYESKIHDSDSSSSST